MSDRTAFYDDLGVAPELEFTSALKQRLDERLTAIDRRAGTPTEEVHEMTLSTAPPEVEIEPRPPRRVWIVAAAAAAVAIVAGTALYLRGNDGDDVVLTPNQTIQVPESVAPPPPPAPTTVPTTVAQDAETSPDGAGNGAGEPLSDQQIADAILLGYHEYNPEIYFGRAPIAVAMDPTIAESIRACDPYRLAFESSERPARVAGQEFIQGYANGRQYVVVLPGEDTARSVYEIFADPQFWMSCGVAYTRAQNPGSAEALNSEFARRLDDDMVAVDPPPIELPGDQSTMLVLQNEHGPVYFSVVRVGRAVIALETPGPDGVTGASYFTPDLAAAAVGTVVRKAEDSLSPGRTLAMTDQEVADAALLFNGDYGVPGFYIGAADRPVTMNGDVAAGLTACRSFADTVFESDRRPASVAYQVISSVSPPALMLNYVVVHPTEEQATAMLDGLKDPEFLSECLPAYYTTLPGQCCDELEAWFPVFVGDDLEPPTIDVDVDDIWVRRYTASWTDERGVVHGPEEFADAYVRVGRVVAMIDFFLTAEDGSQIASIEQFEQVVQRLADRAREAQ